MNNLSLIYGGVNMDNMDFNNNDNEKLNNENINPDSENPAQDTTNTEADDQNTQYQETSDTFDPVYPQDDSFSGTYNEQKNSNINFQKVPVKKRRMRRVFSYIACTLVAAMLGGVAGGAYTNYLIGRKKNYETPLSASQSNPSSIINYSAPASLISKIASDVGPAVVGVDTEVVTKGFFGQPQSGTDSGSGIIFDKKGYIVTNQHVIANGQNIVVTLPGGEKKFKAQVVGQDEISDIAVLKINAGKLDLPVATFGDSSKVRVGDLAIAIGNPMGEEFAGTVTTGIISALNRSVTINSGDAYDRNYKLIQTDAAINPGNSGGALINEKGEVIGINSIKFTSTEVEGMGFAIPINDVKGIIDQLMKNGYASHPYLGVGVVTITEDMAKQYNYPAGVGIDTVTRGSAAEAAGLKPKDIILEMDGVKVTTDTSLVNELMKHKVGDSVKLKIWRDGSTLTVPVTLGEKKTQSN